MPEPLSALYGLTVAEGMPDVFAQHWNGLGLRLDAATWHADPEGVPELGWRPFITDWINTDFGGRMRPILHKLRTLPSANRRALALYSAGREDGAGLRRRWIGSDLLVSLGGPVLLELREAMLTGLIEAALARHRPLRVQVQADGDSPERRLTVLILPFASLEFRTGAIVLGSTL